MANDNRSRYQQGRFRRGEQPERDFGRGEGVREDDGYIARRGFGNRSAGYERGRGHREDVSPDRGYDHRYDSGRERDFSGEERDYGARSGRGRGYGDVFGESRGPDFGRGRAFGDDDRERERGSRGAYGAGPMGAEGHDDHSRYGASDFGRGSRGDHDERGFFERAGDEIRSWFGDDERSGDATRHHRGRGPKSYTRSDARILEDVNDRLTDDPHVDASEIHVEVQNREVTLTGTVNSRFEKRHAEDIAESVSGVVHVQNNLRVQQAMATGMGGSALSGSSRTTATGSGGASREAGTASAGSVGGTGSSTGTDVTTRRGRRPGS